MHACHGQLCWKCPHKSECEWKHARTLWLPQVGLDKKAVLPGRNLAMNSAATLSDPVPDRDCSVATLFSCARDNKNVHKILPAPGRLIECLTPKAVVFPDNRAMVKVQGNMWQ